MSDFSSAAPLRGGKRDKLLESSKISRIIRYLPPPDPTAGPKMEPRGDSRRFIHRFWPIVFGPDPYSWCPFSASNFQHHVLLIFLDLGCLGFPFGIHFSIIFMFFTSFVRSSFSHRFWTDLSLIFAPLEPPKPCFYFSKSILFVKSTFR